MSDSAAVKRSPVREAGGKAEPALANHGPLAVLIRILPDGEFRQAQQLGIEGRYLRIDVPGPALESGALLEIQSGAMLYLGDAQQQSGSVYSVLVEHSVDRAKLGAIRELWS